MSKTKKVKQQALVKLRIEIDNKYHNIDRLMNTVHTNNAAVERAKATIQSFNREIRQLEKFL